MTTSVQITHTDGESRSLSVSFGDHEDGYKRCVGSGNMLTDDERLVKIRLLGAALLHEIQSINRSALGRATPISAHCSQRAMNAAEDAVMRGVKAFFEQA